MEWWQCHKNDELIFVMNQFYGSQFLSFKIIFVEATESSDIIKQWLVLKTDEKNTFLLTKFNTIIQK